MTLDFSVLGYWILFVVSIVEALPWVGILIPGSVFVLAFGVLSAKGIFDVGDLIWFAAIGAIVGDHLSYYLGRVIDKKNLKSKNRLLNKILTAQYLEKGKTFVKKYNNKSIFLSRFTTHLKPIVPFVTGIAKIDIKTFVLWDIISEFLWAGLCISLGYFLGNTFNVIEEWSTRTSIFMLFLVAFIIIIRLIVKSGKHSLLLLSSIIKSVRHSIASNPDIKKLVYSYPKFFQVLQKRLDKNKFYGFPIILLSSAFIYVFFLLIGIVEDIINVKQIVAADIRIANLLAIFHNPELIKFFFWITLLGNWQTIASSAITISILFYLWKKQKYILPLWISILGSQAFVLLAKLIFHRQRPDVAVYAENSFSFPSAHATIAVAFYGFLAYIWLRHCQKNNQKINILFSSLILIFFIGLSRLYLGVHYLSDVLGGYLVGLLWLIMAISISEKGAYHKQLPLWISKKKIKFISSFLIIIEVIFYSGFANIYQPPIYLQSKTEKKIIINSVDTLFTNKDLNHFTETLIGNNQEPLTFVIAAKNDQQLIDSFNKAGWYLADNTNLIYIIKLAQAALFNENYPTAPMTPSFWEARINNFGFEKPTDTSSVRQRHHARFWHTQFKTTDGYDIYVGTASLDIGLKWFITHKIDPDINTERNFLFQELLTTGLIIDAHKKPFVKPMIGKNFAGDNFFSDGEAYFINLK